MQQNSYLENETKKILIVEDDPDFREAVEHALCKSGFYVVGTGSGSRARELLKKMQFDLILSDWKVPDFCGIDLLCYVQQHLKTPFVLMTGFAGFIEQQDVYQSGAAAFLNKPFSQEDLLLTIETCFNLAEHKKNRDPDFAKVECADLVKDGMVLTDLYVRITCENYIKVADGGSKALQDLLGEYMRKGLKVLYIKKTDLQNVSLKEAA
jgi:DNA-binding NtrC family response regulator